MTRSIALTLSLFQPSTRSPRRPPVARTAALPAVYHNSCPTSCPCPPPWCSSSCPCSSSSSSPRAPPSFSEALAIDIPDVTLARGDIPGSRPASSSQACQPASLPARKESTNICWPPIIAKTVTVREKLALAQAAASRQLLPCDIAERHPWCHPDHCRWHLATAATYPQPARAVQI